MILRPAVQRRKNPAPPIGSRMPPGRLRSEEQTPPCRYALPGATICRRSWCRPVGRGPIPNSAAKMSMPRGGQRRAELACTRIIVSRRGNGGRSGDRGRWYAHRPIAKISQSSPANGGRASIDLGVAVALDAAVLSPSERLGPASNAIPVRGRPISAGRGRAGDAPSPATLGRSAANGVGHTLLGKASLCCATELLVSG